SDSHKLLPFLDPYTILQHPKIFCGYSDVTTLHLHCHHLGLSTFYGPNLLTTIAEIPDWHPYSKSWLIKALFDPTPLGIIPSSTEWSSDPNLVFNPKHAKHYTLNPGYQRIQGSGIVHGKLFGGNGETLLNCAAYAPNLISSKDFDGAILFIEDIPQAWNVSHVENLFRWLGSKGYLDLLHGIIIGRLCIDQPLLPFCNIIQSIVSNEYARSDLPILYGVNFGHASPICTLPYDAEAELDIDSLCFRILEQAVL
ncbi:MAG: LD-carboxypeptidase, partial [Clostridia bacterium]|nr:LD-carboxypeptidase [Clostridia bacterium]